MVIWMAASIAPDPSLYWLGRHFRSREPQILR
jgi:hypothetical protein